MADILVVAELTPDGKVRKTTHSAIAMAKQALPALGGSFSILVLGATAKAAAADLTGFGAAKVLACEDASLASYVCEQFAPTVAEVGKAYGLIVACASSFGKDLLPRVAGRLDAAYAGDCSGVSVNGNKVVFKRPMFAGNVNGQSSSARPSRSRRLVRASSSPRPPTAAPPHRAWPRRQRAPRQPVEFVCSIKRRPDPSAGRLGGRVEGKFFGAEPPRRHPRRGHQCDGCRPATCRSARP
jgi:electron transfer flavoprotein alpha subunit